MATNEWYSAAMKNLNIDYLRDTILQEAEDQELGKVGLADEVLEHMQKIRKKHRGRKFPPRTCTNRETVMRFLRGETEGGAYIIDACLAVLKLRIE